MTVSRNARCNNTMEVRTRCRIAGRYVFEKPFVLSLHGVEWIGSSVGAVPKKEISCWTTTRHISAYPRKSLLWSKRDTLLWVLSSKAPSIFTTYGYFKMCLVVWTTPQKQDIQREIHVAALVAALKSAMSSSAIFVTSIQHSIQRMKNQIKQIVVECTIVSFNVSFNMQRRWWATRARPPSRYM